jgi:hypothetical protein
VICVLKVCCVYTLLDTSVSAHKDKPGTQSVIRRKYTYITERSVWQLYVWRRGQIAVRPLLGSKKRLRLKIRKSLERTKIFSRDRMAIRGVWIDNYIYLTLTHRN